jgi:hypothetical protein
MTGNSLNPPLTPHPDAVDQERDGATPKAGPQGQSPGSEAEPAKALGSSADDIGLLLRHPSPDPYLADETALDDRTVTSTADSNAVTSPSGEGQPPPAPGSSGRVIDGSEPSYSASSLSGSESEIALGIKFTPTPESPSPDESRSHSPAEAVVDGAAEVEEPRISWPLLLLASYASALTLAVAWMLWSGRTTRRSDPSESELLASSLPGAPGRGSPAVSNESLPPLPEPNLVRLGETVYLGDLGITPRSIVRRELQLVHLEGATGEYREAPPSLVLTLSLSNRSGKRAFAPLDPAFVRDSTLAVDQPFIENRGRRRILMFRLAIESEWSIEGQSFPTLKPGETTETILVSEPVQVRELSAPLVWHVKLRTSVFQTDVVGVRFAPEDVADDAP